MKSKKVPALIGGKYSDAEESQLLLSLYTGIGTAHFWEDFMARLATLAGFQGALLATVNVHSAEMKAAWAHQVDLEAIRNYITGGFAKGDDLIRYCLAAPSQRFYSSELNLALTIDIEQDSDVYRRWVAPQGIVDVAMGMLDRTDNWSTFIAFYRHSPHGFFSEAQLRQFDRLIPHIQRALWLHGDLLRNQSLPEEIGRWLSLIKMPVLLFDEQFNCCEQNSAARSFFAGQKSIRVIDGRLEVDEEAVTGELGFRVIHAIKSAGDQARTEPQIYQVDVEERPTTFVFIPVKNQAETPVSSAGALVFIYQKGQTPDLDFTPLQAQFGLTAAELAVCEQLAQGLSIQDIATQQRKSRETVRSQLKQVFSKTGTANQADLVVALLTNPLFIDGP